jgi:hypothetical protein
MKRRLQGSVSSFSLHGRLKRLVRDLGQVVVYFVAGPEVSAGAGNLVLEYRLKQVVFKCGMCSRHTFRIS